MTARHAIASDCTHVIYLYILSLLKRLGLFVKMCVGSPIKSSYYMSTMRNMLGDLLEDSMRKAFML